MFFSLSLRRAAVSALFVAASASAGCAQQAQQASSKLPLGADLQIGGLGSAPGQFSDLVDMTFDARGQLLTLEGAKAQTNAFDTFEGNQRVQIFNPDGVFVRQFSLETDEAPAHIAADGQGGIYVSFPLQNRVALYQNGRKTRDFTVEGANGLTHYRRGGKTIVAAIGGFRASKNSDLGGQNIVLLDENTLSIPLSKDLDGVADMAADGAGNFYVLADVNSIFVFDGQGKLRKTIGTGTKLRAKDGSEVRSSVAVTPDGTIYSLAAEFLAKFDARSAQVTRREGLFAWYDNWNTQFLALDPANRLWAASPLVQKNKEPARFHFRPVILRLQSDFLDSNTKGTLETSREGAGLTPRISSEAPGGVAFDLRPFAVKVELPAATRGISRVEGVYRVYDAFKNPIAAGRFDLGLRDGEAAQTSFSFVPPRFGAYLAEVSLQSEGKTLALAGANFGITPPFPNLPALSEGTLERGPDPERQMWSGLPALRLDATADLKKLDDLEKSLQRAQRVGASVWVQFPEARDVSPDVVRAVVTRFKGRVKRYEIINEPDLDMKPDKYLALLRPASEIIRRIDPGAQIMAPACVSINLPWYRGFFEGGGAQLIDIVSFHDYEGHESIDPVHWRAKITALRDIMARHGAANKPLWQSERAIGAMRANTFSGIKQAIRLHVHHDVLQEMGIPPEQNFHYYLTERGYTRVPSFLWSATGPHPGIFTLRTRYALTKDRRYAGTLDFGTNGNTLLSGLRWNGGDGEIISLRAEGIAPLRLRFGARGNGFRLVDSWGNESALRTENGSAEIEIGPLPVYVRVPQGARLAPPRLDFGRNLASGATFSYSGQTKSDFSLLNDGIVGTIHGGIANSNTRGNFIWHGELPLPDISKNEEDLPNSPTLTMSFRDARPVSTLIIRGVPADNTYSALVDFDVEARRGDGWRIVAQVRGNQPASEMVPFPPSAAVSWADDTRNFLIRLPQPVSAREWRLVPRRATFGLAFDAVAAKAHRQIVDKSIPPSLRIAEIEVYGE